MVFPSVPACASALRRLLLLTLVLTTLLPTARSQTLGTETLHALLLPEGRPEGFAVELIVDGRPQTMLLQRHDLRGAGFRVRAWSPRGERDVAMPPPGTYRGQCAELCGKDHGFMPIVVVALPEDEFEAWANEQLAEQNAQGAAQ